MRCYTYSERGYIWLSLIEGMPIIKKYDLLDRVGGIEELYLHFVDHTKEVIELAGNNNFAKMSYYIQDNIIDEEIARMEKGGVDIITIDSIYYPKRLRNIDTPPLLLYYKGNIDVLNNENTLAVVGTRKPTRYGKDVTKMLVRDMVHAGITIISGLARGVDTVSHRTTLEEDGVTIAVVANGLASCYPSENYELMEDITYKGVVISEYPMDGTPYAYRFPERNRIISGLSDGVLITEAGKNSGSLITLGTALDQGRDVYIVPSNINSEAGAGSNEAIKKLQGAIVTESQDILDNYNLSVEKAEEVSDIPLSDVERRIVEAVQREDKHIDELTAVLGGDIGAGELLAILSKLELLGLVTRLPGNYYGK